MDKNEILERSRKENQHQDERDRQIELEAYKSGLNIVLIVTCLMFLALGFKAKATGTSFDDWYLFLLPMWSSMIGTNLVKWRKHSRLGDLINIIVGLAMVVLVFWLRLVGPI